VLPSPYGCGERITESDSRDYSEQNPFSKGMPFIRKLQFSMSVL
jgi:hypothetical protein